MKLDYKVLSGMAIVAALVGCVGEPPEVAAGSISVPKVEFTPNVDAGIPVTQSADPSKVEALKNRYAGLQRRRPDTAFDLRSFERIFDDQQAAERLLTVSGGFGTFYEEPVEVTTPPITEPQPYRRLSGIVVGDSVVAILEFGDGRTIIVRPGQQIEGTPWRVVSINEQRAILRRSGNVLPREITVRLESPPPGFGPNTGGPAGGPGGFPGQPGGFPGGPPGGPGGLGFPGGAPAGGPGGFGGRGGDEF